MSTLEKKWDAIDCGMTGVQFVINHQMGNHDLEYGYKRRHKDCRSRH